jgi:hypothetical protein
MIPSSKKTIVDISAIFFVSLVNLFSVGCAHQVSVATSSSPLHAEVDSAISDARISQQSAAYQVSAIVRSVSDPSTKRAVEDLQKTINELGFRLETATGKITWYESQYDLVIGQRDWWKSEDIKDKSARVQSEKERDALIWIFAVCCGVTAVTAFKPVLSAINGWKQLLFIVGTFVGGFALGFTIGRWCLHFLAIFTPHLPV